MVEIKIIIIIIITIIIFQGRGFAKKVVTFDNH